MDFQVESVHFEKAPGEWKHFTQDKSGDVGQYLWKRGQKLRVLAQRTVGKNSGRLAASIDVSYIPGPNPMVIIGSDVDYAFMVHEGTRPHTEHAAPGRVLRFNIGGKIVYTAEVHHPGTHAQKYLSRHLRKVLND